MDSQKWFSEQLQSTSNAFIWSAEQIAEERRNILPPMPTDLGEWTALRHIYHMWNYESNIALPAMSLWLGGLPHSQDQIDRFMNEDNTWETYSYTKALDLFRKVREEQITMLQQFSATAWSETRKVDFWGDITLHWVVSKTFQHTMEHGNTLMRLALFWH